MKKNIAFVLFLVFALSLSSCKRNPFACFTTNPDEDNLHRMQPVTFYANCTGDADSYFWEFYDRDDSTEYGPQVTKIFADTGDVKVFLIVIGGGKTSSTSRYIHIRP